MGVGERDREQTQRGGPLGKWGGCSGDPEACSITALKDKAGAGTGDKGLCLLC